MEWRHNNDMATPEQLKKYGKKFSKDYQPVRRRTTTVKLSDILRQELDKPKRVRITGKDIETGKKVTIEIETPSREALMSVLLRKALSGDARMLEMIFDRLDGKLPTPIAMSGGLELSPKSRQELNSLEDLGIDEAEFNEID